MTKEEVIIQVERVRKKYKVTTNKDKYTFSEDTILKYLLFKDKIISDEEIKEIIEYDNKFVVFNKCINYLSYSTRAIHEMLLYLNKQTDDQILIFDVLNKLIDLGYLDDEVYAKAKLDYAIRNEKGPRYLESLLKEKKVHIQIIEEVVDNYTEELEMEILRNKALKLKDKNSQEPLMKQKQKLQNKLIRDGFNFSLINTIFSEIEFIDNSLDVLNNEIDKLNNKYKDLDLKDRKQKIIQKLLYKAYPYNHIKDALIRIE